MDNKTQTIIGVFIILAFTGLMGMWMYYPPKAEGPTLNVLTTLSGFLGGAFTMVASYYFGSSSGSKDKDATIAAIAQSSTGDGNAPPVVKPPAAPAAPAAHPEPPVVKPPAAPAAPAARPG